jgi:aminomethyltransferase
METAATNNLIATPLAEAHRAAGACMGAWFGCELPDDFGDVREEQRFAHETVALIDKTYRAYLTFTGPDRVRYLNAILTNDIKSLLVGRSNVSLLLNPQGRILAEIETHVLPDRLLCVSYAMIRPRLVEWLDKYIIMDDVTLTDETEQFGTVALEGPRASQLARELTATDFAAMADGASLDVALRNPERGRSAISCRLVRRALPSSGNAATSTGVKSAATRTQLSVPGAESVAAGAEFIAARKDMPGLWKILRDASKSVGGGPIGYSALSAIRLAQGVPWFGYDFGEKQIPHEAGLQDSHISYTKGCYTGQEIVERVRSRGQVNRHRVGLRFADDAANGATNAAPDPARNYPATDDATNQATNQATNHATDPGANQPANPATNDEANHAANVPTAGAVLTFAGAEVGFVTRAARCFYPPAVLAMGYVRKESGVLGAVLDCGGEKAAVVKLPLVPSSLGWPD